MLRLNQVITMLNDTRRHLQIRVSTASSSKYKEEAQANILFISK